MTGSGERWAIVGGGMLGLSLALGLARSGRSVTVFEAADRPGGLADAWTIGGIEWDRHYHVILLSDVHLRNFVAMLGLEGALRWTTTQTEFYAGKVFYPLTNAIDFLRLPVIGLVDKVRLAATILYASRISDGRKLESIPVGAWLSRLSGARTYKEIWQPLLRAKLGDNYKKASAAFIWAIVRRLYAARRSGMKTEMFGYVDGGYARILQKLEDRSLDAGVRVLTGAKVRRIARTGLALEVVTETSVETFDQVVVTAASPIAARMCEGLSDVEKNQHTDIVYQGIVCVSVLLKKPLHGSYITYITDPSAPFTAVIEMSALVDRTAFGGNALVYLPCYVPSDDALFEQTDDAIEARVLDGLFAMYDHVNRTDILAVRISRVRNVLPIATLNYSASLPAMQTSVPGLSIVNSAQIVNGTLNVNETLKLSDDALGKLLAASASNTRGQSLVNGRKAVA